MSDEEEGKCECEPGLPAWMGTFADLMSLLMCFFVLLLSFSEMDAQKFKRLAGSMAQAFGVQNKINELDIPKGTSIIAQEFSPGIPEPTPINMIRQHTDNITENTLDFDCMQQFDVEQGDQGREAGVKRMTKDKMEKMNEQAQKDAEKLYESLQEQVENGEIDIETQGRKIIIRIREKGSFKSGSAELAPSYIDVMEEIRTVLSQKPGKIQIQGHTDNQPISTARFRSNWELSTARAVSVAHELMRYNTLPADRFEVTGYADTRPLVDNDSVNNRIRNRRVEILILQGAEDTLDQKDETQLKRTGRDILRDLDLEPEYLFDLKPEEIF